MSDYHASWQRTERLLATAKTLLLPEVAAANETNLQQFDEFLDANELGLAFEWLESITYEDQPTCLPLLRLLRFAAEEMNMRENLAELDNRINALGKPLAQ
jgi:ubiquinone biosynthesis protein UbiJ